MAADYFDRLRAETPTRAWVNNPTKPEVGLALRHGADGCTTNPSHAANLLRRAPDEAMSAIRRVFDVDMTDEELAYRTQLELVTGLAAAFRGIHDATEGRAGFVSIQGSPLRDEDADAILEEGRDARRRAPNIAVKIPATAAGLTAFETLVREGTPTIVTEVFSLAQFVESCERYLAVKTAIGTQPPFFVSPITGIFGDYLKAVVRRDGLDVPDTLTEMAGVTLARACYEVAVDRAYPVRLLCGGARTPIDLTGLVGGALSVTINWSTFADALAGADEPTSSIDRPLDPTAVDTLVRTFADVERALRPDGLTVPDYEAFGPVRHFRGVFEAGWEDLVRAIQEYRLGQLEAGVAAGR